MKYKILFCLLIMVAALSLSTRVDAALINRGPDTLGNRLIYDDDLGITWYDYSNSANTWQNQVDWAAALSVTHNSNTYDDWRLPTTVDGPFVWGDDGTTTAGYNITNSEMGHLYYTELQNKGYYATDGTNPQAGWGLSNTEDFQNLISSLYWSGTEYSASTDDAWYFGFDFGRQGADVKFDGFYGLAVRSGDVAAGDNEPIPEPATIALLGIGLVGLAGGAARRKFKKKELVKH